MSFIIYIWAKHFEHLFLNQMSRGITSPEDISTFVHILMILKRNAEYYSNLDISRSIPFYKSKAVRISVFKRVRWIVY